MPGSVADRNPARTRALQSLVIELGRRDYQERYPDASLPPVVVLICAFEEEANLPGVLARVPQTACGLPVLALVVVDGGDDATAEVARHLGARTFVLPVNLGHGVALRIGYDLCVSGGAQYVVTLDADGQNDPQEIETMLRPLVDDAADFVLASRRLGMDTTSDRYRRAGVVVFSALVNALLGTHFTDTSNGYRVLRATMLSDVAPRLEQDQYQTADLLITCVRKGWRVVERPTVWHERQSGSSKKGANLIYGLRYATVVWRTWRRER